MDYTNLHNFLGNQWCDAQPASANGWKEDYRSAFNDAFYTNPASPGYAVGNGIDHLTKLWQQISNLFQNNNNVIGYDLLNEPTRPTATGPNNDISSGRCVQTSQPACTTTPCSAGTIVTQYQSRASEIMQMFRGTGPDHPVADNHVVVFEPAPFFEYSAIANTFTSMSSPNLFSDSNQMLSYHWYRDEYAQASNPPYVGSYVACTQDLNTLDKMWGNQNGADCIYKDPAYASSLPVCYPDGYDSTTNRANCHTSPLQILQVQQKFPNEAVSIGEFGNIYTTVSTNPNTVNNQAWNLESVQVFNNHNAVGYFYWSYSQCGSTSTCTWNYDLGKTPTWPSTNCLTATSVTPTSVSLAWTPASPSQGATAIANYHLIKSVNSGSPTILSSTSISYQDSFVSTPSSSSYVYGVEGADNSPNGGFYTMSGPATATNANPLTVPSGTAPDFSMAANLQCPTLLAGTPATASSIITLSSWNSFTGTIGIAQTIDTSSANKPTVQLSSTSVIGSGSVTVSISIDSNTSFGIYHVTITGTSGSLSRSMILTVNVAQDFALSNSSSGGTVAAGATASSTISVVGVNSFNGVVSLTVSPSVGIFNCNLYPSTVSLGTLGTSRLNCSSSSTGTFTATVTGTSGSLTRSVTVTFTVNDFFINISPGSTTIPAAKSGQVTISANSINGYSGTISAFQVIYLPSCVGYSLSKSSLVLSSGGSDSLAMTLNVGPGCAASTSQIGVSGADGSNNRRSQGFTLITSEFQLSVSPSQVGFEKGYSGQISISLASINGYPAATLPLSIQNLPSCASYTPNPLGPVNLQQSTSTTVPISITIPSTCTSTGSFPVTIQAYDQATPSVTRSTVLNLAVGNYAMTASPNSVTAIIGTNTLPVTISVGPWNGPTDVVSFSATGPPCTITYNFDPSASFLSSSATTTSSLTMNAGANCSPGTVTVSAVGTHTQTATISLAIVAGGGGGGGSVASWTMITLANRTVVPVQTLKAGVQILSYDTVGHQFVNSTITSFVKVTTNNYMIIQTVTGIPLITDQNPAQKLYVMFPNGTQTMLPVTQLKVGYYLFNTYTQSWVQITWIYYQNTGTYTMYDIYNTNPHNYIANGYLDPWKT